MDHDSTPRVAVTQRLTIKSNIMLKTRILLFAVAVVCCGCSKNSGAVSSEQHAGATLPQFSAVVPTCRASCVLKFLKVGQTEKPTSDMRAAQYKLPKAAGDSEDALLVLYYFGQGQGGSAQANIDRWIEQMKQPDGSSSKETSEDRDPDRQWTASQHGRRAGKLLRRNVAGQCSGRQAIRSYRLRAAVIETPKGSYFVKLTGPEKTVGHWDQAYSDYFNPSNLNN